jgi:hypothetical protein
VTHFSGAVNLDTHCGTSTGRISMFLVGFLALNSIIICSREEALPRIAARCANRKRPKSPKPAMTADRIECKMPLLPFNLRSGFFGQLKYVSEPIPAHESAIN